jgi:hypothetical protein
MIEGGYKPRQWRLAVKVVYPSGVEWAIKPLNPTKEHAQMGFIPFHYRRDSNV